MRLVLASTVFAAAAAPSSAFAIDYLSADEAAVLVGMVNNPRVFNPRTNPKAALERRNIVLNRMVTNHYLPEEEAAAHAFR